MPLRRAEHPWLYPINVERHRLARSVGELFYGRCFSRIRPDTLTPHRLKTHESILLRRLEGVDQRLQINKVTNLRLAAAKFDGQVIRPGKTFSFWHCLGRPTERRGYLTGLLLADGAACEGTGGGLCQMANLLYWLALHSPLTVTERHHHSLDVFPDSGRVLPFGSGASVFYNYVDLQFRNDTKLTLRFRVKVDEEHLHGELWTDELSELSYHVQERDHRFYQDESGTWWRENRLYQIAVDRTSGNTIDEKLIVHNVSKVLYLR